MEPPFKDRRHAGAILAGELRDHDARPNVVVLALPRGGVPVAHEVSETLHLPMDVFVVRKLGVPGREELAMGAIAGGGVKVIADDVVSSYRIPPDVIDRVVARESEELLRRDRAYRGDTPPPDVAGRTVIVVDDGLATGASMRAAIQALRAQKPARIIGAVPIAAQDVCREVGRDADEMVCAITAQSLTAVGAWYEDFDQVSDEEVRALLALARTRDRAQHSAP